MKYAFLGSGNMARAIIGGMVRSGVPGADILVVNPGNPASVAEVQALYGTAPASPADIKSADAVVLAFKPQTFHEAAPVYKAHLPAGSLIVSIMAGVPIKTLENVLGTRRVVRVMPNLALSVGLGASGYALGAEATEKDAEAVERMFSATGISVRVPEKQIDDVGALSGSGAAYICYLLEIMREVAIEDGVDPSMAAALARQTLLGAAKILETEDMPPEELRRRITSKKGTTDAAINEMTRLGFPDAVKAGYRANKARSAELSKM